MANQGCNLFNISQFLALITQFDNIQLVPGIPVAQIEAQIQAMIDEAMNPILGVQAAINAQIALLAPLTSIPTDLGSAISWITRFIDQSIVIPHANLIAQEAALVAQIASLTAAITSLESRIGISITIPTVPHC
jgi:hypothetical protein